MDASQESSVNSRSFCSDQYLRVEQAHPSLEGLVGQIVATRPNKETVC